MEGAAGVDRAIRNLRGPSGRPAARRPTVNAAWEEITASRLARESEGLIVASKPGNAGGAKGPQFKVNVTSGKGLGDWR